MRNVTSSALLSIVRRPPPAVKSPGKSGWAAAAPGRCVTLFQVMMGSGSPWELHGSCTLVPTSTVMSLGMLANTGVTARQGTPDGKGGNPEGPGALRVPGCSPALSVSACHLPATCPGPEQQGLVADCESHPAPGARGPEAQGGTSRTPETARRLRPETQTLNKSFPCRESEGLGNRWTQSQSG